MKNLLTMAALALATFPVAAQPDQAPAAKAKPAKAAGAPAAEKNQGTKTVVRGQAMVRVLHAVPGQGAIDVYANNEKIVSNAAYKSVSNYATLKSGKSTLKVVPGGQNAPLILEVPITLVKDKTYSLIIHNAAKPELTVLNEATGKEMPDKARLRVVHVASGGVPVLLTRPAARGEGFAKITTKPLEPGQDSVSSQTPGLLVLQARGGDDKLLKELKDVKAEAGRRYTVFAIGDVAGSGDTALDLIVAPVTLMVVPATVETAVAAPVAP